MNFIDRLANIIIALVNSILLIFNVSPADIGQPDLDLSQYDVANPAFVDEFNGPNLDTSKWGQHNSQGIRKGGYWYMDNAKVEGGNLVITTQYKEDGQSGPGWYTAGICTAGKFEQAYGYYECRCILPKGVGLWSAFWLTNSNVTNLTTGNATKGAEIDVFESPFYYLGGRAKNKVTLNIHYNGYELQTRYKNIGIYKLANDPYEEYNTYGVEWTPDEYIFYINGKEVGRSKFGGVSQEKEYMILSCEVDGAKGQPSLGWSGNIERNNKKTFKAEYKVDYVKVYKKYNQE